MSGPVQVTAAGMVGFLPRRPEESHKGDYGKVYILGGKVGYTGAPVLSARAALRTGAGLVSLGVPEAIYPIVAGHCLCAMPSPLPCGGDGALSREALPAVLKALAGKNAALIGPGLGRGEGARETVLGAIEAAQCPLVVDADGINALCGHIDVLAGRRDRVSVLTPHGGEFARLLGRERFDPLSDGAAFARDTGCILVLKGHRTLTLLPDGRAFQNTTGNPGMAAGGSGDVLAGMILALLGQGFPPDRAAWGAVYLHGRAGDLAAQALGEYAMTPADLLEYLPAALKEGEAPRTC